MASIVKVKQSSVPGKIPTNANLELGELAVNTYDGKLFLKKNVSGTESVVEVGTQAGWERPDAPYIADANDAKTPGAYPTNADTSGLPAGRVFTTGALMVLGSNVPTEESNVTGETGYCLTQLYFDLLSEFDASRNVNIWTRVFTTLPTYSDPGGTWSPWSLVTGGKTPLTISGTSTNNIDAFSHSHQLTVTKADVGLSNVDNTSDTAKPISTATQAALNNKADAAHWHDQTDITGLVGALSGKADTAHTHIIDDITGLQAALNGKQAAGSYVPASRTVTAGNGLTGGGGLDANRTITLGTPGTITNSSTNSVTSTSHTHALTVTKSDVGLGNVDNTSDANKPISTATQTALNGKAASSHTHSINDVTGLQTALDAKAPTANPTFTGAIYDNGSVRGNVVAVGTGSTINCSLGNYFTKTMSSNWTPNISNVPAGYAFGFVVELFYSSGSLTLPSGWVWENGSAPSLSSGTWLLIWIGGTVKAVKRGIP